MKHSLKILGIVALVLLIAPLANATTYTLTNRNSTVTVDDSSASGMYNWTVDGTDILYQQWFWYRIGSTGGESSIDTLPLLSAENTDRSLILTYGSATGLEIEISYFLTGGLAGTHRGDVAETININNNGRSPLDFHFFQYSDFDLNRTDLVDAVQINPGLQSVRQYPVPATTGPVLSETVLTPRPSHAEANYYANTLSSLNDGSPTTLNDVLNAGPGDVTWAFQWDVTLGAGGSFQISKDKNLAPVPEPATLALLGGVMVLLARRFRKAAV